MNINDAFPGKYFKAADVAQPQRLTITNVAIEQMQDGTQKPAISFSETQQMFVLNKTNANTLSATLGAQTEAWHGKQIELYQDTASFQGRNMPCVRCRLPQADSGAQPAAAATPPAATDGDVPF